MKSAYIESRDWLAAQRWLLPVLILLGFGLAFAIPEYNLFNKYVQLVMMYVGINIILAVSLNLVNGYMGEFSLAHAGFMAVGAYTAALLSMKVLPVAAYPALFPLTILAGGLAAAVFGLIVAVPSFKTRGDYLALITLAFLMIVKSLIENIDAIGGPRGIPGIRRLTTLPWVFFWVVVTVWAIRNFVYSKYGRGVLAVREDEIASDLMSVDTRRVKFLAFTVSSFFAGIAGGLFAHLLQFISPRVFDIIKTTDILIMVYLGGIASICGSILGATVYTVLLELLRPSTMASLLGWLPAIVFDPLNEYFIRHLGVWRMVVMPLALVLVMIFAPRGIMGLRELRWLVPKRDSDAHQRGAENENEHDIARGQ
ncbi:MAG: branched-chain amino acid ABC transporter permease [Candidatus Competibacteraceae bacterium]|nr:branched-chain amino acid ABC transporter permease [Candidatus Competibacteraceae bacterium]MBK8963209.1 branched-chain amino acid ABC transporter permease [Candidatus Competibacteraceae bacterium]MBK9952173.1 branched-chain amino acid ABC transporter permease [Candidatus Competibacteraceae bacterium]